MTLPEKGVDHHLGVSLDPHVCLLSQVYGKADVSHAVHALNGNVKKAAGDALQKALSSAVTSKPAVPALDVAAVASYAISVSCDASPTAPAPQQQFSAFEQVLPAGPLCETVSLLVAHMESSKRDFLCLCRSLVLQRRSPA